MGPRYHRTCASCPRTGATCARAALLAAVCTVLLALPAQALGASTLVVEGAGDGHGVGMSQEGAMGYAQHGWSYQAILAHYYTGTSIGRAPANAVVRVLLHGRVRPVPLEQYVRGVVAAEVSADWPMAALEAQAVASRTYALTAHAGGSRFDVYPDTRSQMYLGKAGETARTNAAVAATAGQIVTYAGQAAITYFFASSGGHTESVQNAFPGSDPQPWLLGVADPYDGGPLHRWRVALSLHEAGVRLRGLEQGAFRGIEVLARGASPRIVSAYVLGTKGRVLVSGAQLAQRLGLYDTWAYFSVSDAHGTHAEPDLSGGPGSPPVASGPPATAGTVDASGVGGASAPSSPEAPGTSGAGTGGVAAQ
jgi:SpoIID/LytB domain protein